MDDLACTECMWCGDSFIQDYGYCPDCGAVVEKIEAEYLPSEKPFNWNKS